MGHAMCAVPHASRLVFSGCAPCSRPLQGLAAAANATRQATAQLKPLGPPAPNAQPNTQPNTKPVAQQPAASQPKAVAAAAAASGGAPAAAAEAAPAAASGNGGGGGGAASVAAAAAESAKAASPEAVVAAAPAEGSADTRRAAGFSFSHRGVDAAAADASATNVWRRGDDAAFRVRARERLFAICVRWFAPSGFGYPPPHSPSVYTCL